MAGLPVVGGSVNVFVVTTLAVVVGLWIARDYMR